MKKNEQEGDKKRIDAAAECHIATKQCGFKCFVLLVTLQPENTVCRASGGLGGSVAAGCMTLLKCRFHLPLGRVVKVPFEIELSSVPLPIITLYRNAGKYVG